MISPRTTETFRYLSTGPVARAKSGGTPHAVVHRDNKACVRYFAPDAPRHAPVFVSMPLINTWTVFDLAPGRSVIEALIKAGVPLYVLDWGVPGPEDSQRPLADYVDTLLGRAMDRARRHAAVQHMDALGYCVGGTFLAVHLARNPEVARRAAFLCTPIDFHASGRLARWADPATFPLDSVIDGFGNFPAELMKTSFRWLRPAGQSAKWVGLWERIDDPGFRELWAAMERWNEDAVDFPGEAYREYVRRCYFDNALVRGGWKLAGRPVDLSAVKVPALSIAASEDHIVPPPSAHALASVWGGPVATKTIRGGHVGVCIGKALPDTILEWVRS
ncbi:MAG: alpha/beta fold hydrolase [Myxococcota bacterium]